MREEVRKACCFDFEQMINLQLNLQNPSDFLNGKTTISNINQTYDEEEGNFALFQKMSGNSNNVCLLFKLI
jgi:3'-phosphoadenosine 5'-phosphosulfate sulfotransferase